MLTAAATDPRWASWALNGQPCCIFICIACSGVHRSLGVHISKVKSVDLDDWTPEQLDAARSWGNERANAYYEHSRPSGGAPPSSTRHKSFWQDKYVQKIWARPGPLEPALPSSPSSRPAQVRRSSYMMPSGSPMRVEEEDPMLMFDATPRGTAPPLDEQREEAVRRVSSKMHSPVPFVTLLGAQDDEDERGPRSSSDTFASAERAETADEHLSPAEAMDDARRMSSSSSVSAASSVSPGPPSAKVFTSAPWAASPPLVATTPATPPRTHSRVQQPHRNPTMTVAPAR